MWQAAGHVDTSGVVSYGRSVRRASQKHCDFDRNSRSRIDKYVYCVQNDGTLMPHLLAGALGAMVSYVPR